MDLAKAFDMINREILLYKVEKCDIRGVAKKLIKSYLTNRKQMVYCDGFSSSLFDINMGVSQGNILSSTLFFDIR